MYRGRVNSSTIRGIVIVGLNREQQCCRHYNGSFHNDTCELGICYRDVTPKPDEPGSAYREPCRRWFDGHALKVIQETGPQGVCDKYDPFTEEELAEQERQMALHIANFLLTIPLCEAVKLEHAGKDWQGVVECPVCKGKLHMTHSAYNGHVWGKCETEDCLSWIE